MTHQIYVPDEYKIYKLPFAPTNLIDGDYFSAMPEVRNIQALCVVDRVLKHILFNCDVFGPDFSADAWNSAREAVTDIWCGFTVTYRNETPPRTVVPF